MTSALMIAGLAVGGFGLLILIIGSILLATAKVCSTADEACNSVKNRRKVGIGMVVMGCVLVVSGGIMLIYSYKNNTVAKNVTVLNDVHVFETKGVEDCVKQCTDTGRGIELCSRSCKDTYS